MASVVDLIGARRSVREFSGRAVPDDVLSEVLEAGRLSPSGGNEQPWRFGVVRDRTRIKSVAGLLGLQEGCLPSELLVMGYPAGPGEPRAKKPIQEVVFRDRWSDRDA